MVKHARQRNPADPDIEVDTMAAAAWYAAWPGLGGPMTKCRQINVELRNALGRAKGDGPEWLIGNPQTWSNWRNPLKRRPSRPTSVLKAFLRLTGVDLSHGGVLTRQALNFTPLVRLDGAVARRLSNAPEDDGVIIHRIEVGSLQFRRHGQVVKARLFGEYSTPERDIGTATVGLMSAVLDVETEARTEPGFTRLVSGEDREFGSSHGCDILIDHDRGFAFAIDKTATDQMLHGELQRVDLGRVYALASTCIVIRVLGTPYVQFSVADAERSKEARARDQLMSQVLGQRWRDRTEHVLSLQRLVVKC